MAYIELSRVMRELLSGVAAFVTAVFESVDSLDETVRGSGGYGSTGGVSATRL